MLQVNFAEVFQNSNSIEHLWVVASEGKPAGIYLFKVNNEDTGAISVICSKLVIRTPERRQWLWIDFPYCFGVYSVYVEQVNAGRECCFWNFCTLINDLWK